MEDTRIVMGRAGSFDDKSGLRVLVVEDHADGALSLAMLLRFYGHEVEVAADGPAALRAARDNPPDVVLLDIGLPGMDGYEVARRLDEQMAVKKAFLIAVTGYGQPSDVRRSEEAGIALHLVKPVDPRVLQGVLRRFQRVIAC